MAVPPQKRHRPAQGRKRRKSSPLKTSASVNESHSSDESLIEYLERTHPPEIETLSPRNPPKAVTREYKMAFGGRGISRLAPNPYVRLRGGTGGPGPAAPPGTPAAPEANRGLSRALNPLVFNQEAFVIPPAKSIVTMGEWPVIFFGDDVPCPRVRFIPDPRDPQQHGKDLSLDLIKKAPGKWVIPGTAPTGDVRLDPSHPRYRPGYKVPISMDSTIGLGGLKWSFEPGDDEKAWKGLTENQVIEFLYRSTEEILSDWLARDQLRDSISKGPYAKQVENVEDPLPPLPQQTQKDNFLQAQYGKRSLADAQTRFENSHWFWKDYTRPSLVVRPGDNKTSKAPPLLAQRLFAHMRGAIEIEDNIGEIYDTSSEDDNGPPRGLGGGPGGGPSTLPRKPPKGLGGGPGGRPSTLPRRPPSRSSETPRSPQVASKEGSKEGDPMEMDPEQGPDPMDTTEDGDGRTARVDRQSPLLQEEAIGTPESPLSPARSGISTASRSSSSSALSQGAEAPGNKRKAKNKQKAKKKQAKTVIPSATSNRPARQRKPPNRLGFSRTTQHRGEPGPRLVKNTKIPRPFPAQQKRSVPDGDTRELGTDDVDDDVTVKPGPISLLASHESNEAIAYRNACEQICDDPRERKKYFPAIGKVRRIRSWSGSKLPPDVERKVQRLLPRSSTVFRPFGPRKVQEDWASSTLESTESTTRGCQV